MTRELQGSCNRHRPLGARIRPAAPRRRQGVGGGMPPRSASQEPIW